MVGVMKPIYLEKWQQTKNARGSLIDTKLITYPIWAEVKKRSGGRTYESYQTKLSNNMEVRINFRDPFDLNGQWKVVYNGRRHTVLDIEKVNETRFNYLLLIESK